MGWKYKLIFVLFTLNATNGFDIPDEIDLSIYANISKPCVDDITKLHIHLQNYTLWAVEMWEASAKEITGILYGTNYQLGNFDECLTPIRGSKRKNDDVLKQYCLAKVVFENKYPKNFMHKQMVFDNDESAINKIMANGNLAKIERDVVYMALCAPKNCTISDLEILTNSVYDMSSSIGKFNLSYSVHLNDDSCQVDKSNEPFTVGSIIFIFIITLLVVLTIICTSVHYYYRLTFNPYSKIFESFSAIRHFESLGKDSKDEPELRVFYGFRIIAMVMVIYSHRTGTTAQGPLANREFFESVYNHWEGDFILQNEMFVDTFFVLSGILTIYQLLKYAEKSRYNYFNIIFMRYIRLMLLYVFVIFFTATLLSQSGTGPLWNVIMEKEAELCIENWWTNVLMINNYVNVERMCMVHAWYVPCDFHYFLITLIICTILKDKSKTKLGLTVLTIFMCLSIIIPSLITYIMNFPALLGFYNNFLINPRGNSMFQYMYIKSHTRISPYILGLYAGYVLYKYYKPGQKKFSFTKSVVTLLLIIGAYLVLVFITPLFTENGVEYDAVKFSLYGGLQRPLRAFLVALLLLLCIFGQLPFMTPILGCKVFMVLGKLTYGAYLMHMGMQLRAAASIRDPVYFTFYGIFQSTVSDAALAYLYSLIGFVLIESPGGFLIKSAITPKPRGGNKQISDVGKVNDAYKPGEEESPTNINTVS